MREAGFRYVFLGIENILEEDLQFLRVFARSARTEVRLTPRWREMDSNLWSRAVIGELSG